MTTFTDSRYNTRNLIRSFAIIDAGFDACEFSMTNDPRTSSLHELNAKVGVLISLPVMETVSKAGSVKPALSIDELESLNEFIPRSSEEPPKNVLFLREALRDRLYELLLRLDHCSDEQLFSRFIIIPPDYQLCLFHLNQLVLYLASTCVENARRYAAAGT